MQRPFREHHLLEMLNAYDPERGALDRFIALYFSQNRALGSKDRRYLRDTAYHLIRWQGRLDALGGNGCWETRLGLSEKGASETGGNLTKWEAVSFPQDLWELLVEAYGVEKTHALCTAMNEEAPIAIRCNLAKTSRSALLDALSARFDVEASPFNEAAIRFNRREALFALPEFKQGFFEVQDEASQSVADLIQAEPGQRVMDFCAGAAGKTLAFAYRMEGKGQIILHDIRERALEEARKRLRRAGIQNAQTLCAEHPHLKKWKAKCDWVLVDAPCTGTGTYRRNPDMKWKFSREMLDRLVGEQRVIFERALSFVRPGGRIVYATCSLLPQENQQQVEHFCRTYPLELCGTPFETLVESDGPDALFGAVFKRS